MSFATRTTTFLRPQYRFLTPITASTARFFSATAAGMTRISDVIKRDHGDLREAHRRITEAKTHDEKVQWRNQFTWELARHSIGEELVVYPAFEKHLPDGKAMADHDRSEHQTVRLCVLQAFSNLWRMI